jgi:hypothetical protein
MGGKRAARKRVDWRHQKSFLFVDEERVIHDSRYKCKLLWTVSIRVSVRSYQE